MWAGEASGLSGKDSKSSRSKIQFSRDWLIRSRWKHFVHFLQRVMRSINVGRKRIDPLVLYKILILQQLLDLSDEEFEF